MSGIAAVRMYDTRPPGELIQIMQARLEHRGGDDADVWMKGNVGLGQQSFKTTPATNLDELPLTDWTGDITLVADARLDNRDDLLARLGMVSDDDDPVGDGALILAAYRAWGYDCPAYMVGDFAFIIWDAGAGAFFCARDHLGVKPLYYTVHPQYFACASEIDALLALPNTPDEVDEVMIGDYLTSQIGVTSDPARTFYAAIKRVPAAGAVIVRQREVQTQRYWTVDPTRVLNLRDDAEYADAFRELFTTAVAARVRGAARLGIAASLSGGIDSSSVVCVARPLLDRSLITVHIGAALPEADERAYVGQIIRGGGIEHYEIGWSSPLNNLDVITSQLRSPTHMMNIGMTQRMMRTGVEHGARIFLDGIDGDLVVGHGFARLTELAAAGDLKTYEAEVAALSADFDTPREQFARRYAHPLLEVYADRGNWGAFWQTVRRYRSHFGYSIPGLVWTWAIRPRLRRMRMFGVLRQGELPLWQQLNPMILPEFASATGVEQRLQAARTAPPLDAREEYAQVLQSGAFSLVLPEYDQLAARLGVDNRHPFCDKRLVEFCAALPGDQKLRGGFTRGILRRAMEGVLPDDIRLRRDKTNFQSQFTEQLLTHDRPVIERALNSEVGAAYLDLNGLRRLHERVQSTRDRREVGLLFRAVKLIIWLEGQRN